MLSSFLLRIDTESTERVYPDIPSWERNGNPRKSDSKECADACDLIILGVPEAEENSDKAMKSKHDLLQWKFISETIKTDGVAVIDLFRIPKSSKYKGTGPNPLKLTLLRSDMVGSVRAQWKRYGHLLPREVRIGSSVRTHGSTTAVEAKTQEQETSVAIKNGQPPALPESVPL